MESREDLGGMEGGHIEETAPDLGGWEAAGREAYDNSEVVGAAFEGAPEIRVDRCGGCGYGARGEDDFVA